MQSPWTQTRWLVPAVAFVVVFAARFAIAVSRLDDATFQYYTANIAVSVLEGMPLERTQLPLIAHNRGSMVAGYVAVPFVALFGNTLLAIKLEAIVFSAATAALLAFVLERGAGGRVAATLGTLSFAFLPPGYVVLDVMPMGSHVDTVLFTFAALACVCAWKRGEPVGVAGAALLGLVGGVGLFFSMHSLVVIPALLLAWLASGTRPLRPKVLVAFALALALPLAPAPLFLESAEQATHVVNKPLEEWLMAPDEVAARLVDAVTHSWPLAWGFDEHVGGALGVAARASFGLAVLVGLAFAVPALRRREPGAVFLVVYPFLLLGAYAVTSFELKTSSASGLGGRQVAPAVPCLAAWVALGAADLVRRGRRGAGGALALAGILPGVLAFASLFTLDVWRGQPPVRGSDFAIFKDHVALAAEDDPRRILDWLEKLEPDWPGFRPLVATNVRPERQRWADADELAADVLAVNAGDARLRPYFLVAIGRAATQDDALIGELPRIAHDHAAELGEDGLAYLLHGFGDFLAIKVGEVQLRRRATGANVGRPIQLFTRVVQMPEEVGRRVAEGLGFAFGEMASPYHGGLLGTLNQVADWPERLQRAFFVAAGWGYRTRFVEATYEPPTFLRVLDVLPPERHADFRDGLAWGDSPLVP